MFSGQNCPGNQINITFSLENIFTPKNIKMTLKWVRECRMFTLVWDHGEVKFPHFLLKDVIQKHVF